MGKRVKGIIFDLDGTLVDSLDDLADSMNIVLDEFNFPVHNIQSYKYFIGKGIPNLIRAALPEFSRDEETISSCHDRMLEIYNHNCTNKTRPYEGIIDLLNDLRSLEIKLAVFSNKADGFTRKIINVLLPGYFDIVTGMITEDLRKPNPAGAVKIMEDFKIKPHEMLYVGDSGIDMQTARNAGIPAVGALWGFRTAEELLNSGAGHLIEKPRDLLKLIENH